ncbi:Endonuclease IV [Tissierella praeacuta DSM 18095]|uniref:Probable endonuclease 4 n=1 Tax=Tissierella praeacuta DSM 18095 TaxID=1123404 RepID=A0A1M4W0F6_9FIRM|nr:deoxyribonuclease IV [Tissierella praeacuta]SHE74620.1 Endonuclease IV [Tissierella praeacuta DSM 18095]SUP00241.1 Probable endonuclease 4 [Tissierella praeacuta]
MLNIGCHLSVSKGLYSAALDAISIGANTFQFFTRNPRGGKAKEIDMEDINKLKQIMEEYKFAPIFAHGAYTMNLASNKKETREFANMILKDDLERLKLIPNTYYIFHPGSHVGQGSETGIELIVNALNEAIDENNNTIVLLEGMSGKGTEIGRSMEELKAIIDGVNYNENLGICIDSCHLYSSGYDIVNDLDGVLEEIDKIIGLDRVKAVHLNDSKVEFNSNKDRHEVIGKGTIGLEAIINIINHPLLKNLPFNLETPNELDGYKKEIEMLRKEYR